LIAYCNVVQPQNVGLNMSCAVKPITFSDGFRRRWLTAEIRKPVRSLILCDGKMMKIFYFTYSLTVIPIYNNNNNNIYCSLVVTRWQCLFYMYTKYEIGYY